MTRAFKIVWAGVLVLLLVAIRAFQDILFYDPLIEFFKVDHSTEVLPAFDTVKLIGNTALRFGLNTILSLGVLWILFRKKEILKLSALLYGIIFVLLIVAFIVLLNSEAARGHLALFYVRRFLIQPIFLLLLIPAFYFQKKS